MGLSFTPLETELLNAFGESVNRFNRIDRVDDQELVRSPLFEHMWNLTSHVYGQPLRRDQQDSIAQTLISTLRQASVNLNAKFRRSYQYSQVRGFAKNGPEVTFGCTRLEDDTLWHQQGRLNFFHTPTEFHAVPHPALLDWRSGNYFLQMSLRYPDQRYANIQTATAFRNAYPHMCARLAGVSEIDNFVVVPGAALSQLYNPSQP